jgi:aryl-alcohol dehydrogenase-like predicted oxidoreductase
MSIDTENPKDLMEYRHLGRTGLKVSVLSFGAWVKLFKKITKKKDQILSFR